MAHLRLADAQPRYEPAERRQQIEVGDGRRVRQPIPQRKLVTIGGETPRGPNQPDETYSDGAEADHDAEGRTNRLDEPDFAKPRGPEEEQRLRHEKVGQQRPAEPIER